jgi:hypothetical protein
MDTALQSLISILAGSATKPSLDWPTIIELADTHRVLPTLYHRSKDLIPAAQREQRQTVFLARACRNIVVTEELLRILDLLSRSNIEAIPFKGAVLALQAYGNLEMRQFDDIDLLLPGKRILKAVELLTANGYASYPKLSGSRARAYVKSCQGWLLQSATTNTFIDIKPAIGSHALHDDKTLRKMLSRLVTLQFEGRSIPCLNHVDTLIAICIHGNHHLWQRLAWIMDVSMLARQMSIDDWNSAVVRARDQGSMRRLLVGIHLAAELLNTAVPDFIRELVDADPTVARLATVATEALCSFQKGDTDLAAARSYRLNSMERARDRLRMTIRQLFVPASVEWSIVALPAWAYPLYYIIRPLRLIRDGLRRLLR